MTYSPADEGRFNDGDEASSGTLILPAVAMAEADLSPGTMETGAASAILQTVVGWVEMPFEECELGLKLRCFLEKSGF